MNTDILKLLTILLKHTAEIPAIIAAGQAAAKALTTKGVEHIDPLVAFLNTLKPVEADAIAGGFLAVAPKTEAQVATEFGKIGDGTLLKKLLELLQGPLGQAILPLILKILGV